MSLFDDMLMGFNPGNTYSGINGPVMIPSGGGGNSFLSGLGGIIGAIDTAADIYQAGSQIYDRLFGDDSSDDAIQGLPQLPSGMPVPNAAGPRPSGTACDMNGAMEIAAMVNRGEITESRARVLLRQMGCLKKKKRRKCAPGYARKKMCVRRASNYCGPRPARRKKKSCASKCGTKRRRRLTAKQIAAGFGGRRRMR